MGMDLVIYARRKDNGEQIELCYARKFWGLWYKFCDCPQVWVDPYEKYLTREAWRRFIDIIEGKMDLIRTADLFYDLEENGHELTAQQQDWINQYEDWHGDTFESTPVLGYDFDAVSLINWYENKDKVWEYLYNDDYHVIIINSF